MPSQTHQLSESQRSGSPARVGRKREPMLITQNGEAKAVIRDVASCEETQETLALLEILSLGNREIEAGKVKPLEDVVRRLLAKKNGV